MARSSAGLGPVPLIIGNVVALMALSIDYYSTMGLARNARLAKLKVKHIKNNSLLYYNLASFISARSFFP